MQRYALIGYPLGHSFSASFFNKKFLEENIESEYLLHPLETLNGLDDMIREIPALKGFNVTIPHKRTVMEFLDSVSPAAKEIGAVNTVRIKEEGNHITFHGFNTDYIGFRKSLEPLISENKGTALILGSGGASAAVGYALSSMGISYRIVSRSAERGNLTYEEIDDSIMSDIYLIINCTPLGTWPNIDSAPSIPYQLISPSMICFDLVYNPAVTKFMKLCAAQGATIKNGLEMLHIQAEEAWRIWTSEKIKN